MGKKKKKKRSKSGKKKSKPIPPRLMKIMDRIKDICQGEGLPATQLRKLLQGIPSKECELAINELLKRKEIQMFTDPQNKKERIFMAVSEEQASKYKGLGSNEIQILRLIEASTDRGLWLRHIKIRTKLPQNDIMKSIANLIQKRLIKEVRCKKGRNRKVYMAFDVNPSSEVVGGAWYLRSELNVELIQGVSEFIAKKVKELGKVTVEGMLKLLKKNNTDNSKIQSLRNEHLQQIFDTLMLDGSIEPVTGIEGVSYKVSRLQNAQQENAYSDVPCSTCPVFMQCTDKGNISPASCVYLKEWQQY